MKKLNGFHEEISKVLGSSKRVFLLFLLNEQPMSYTQIKRGFEKNNISAGSSEIYKHLNVLLKHKYITKKGRFYLVTLRGKKLVENLEEVSNVPAKIPKLELVF
mgnify:CR=1 FL=1